MYMKSSCIKYKKISQSGFTIVETLVAISILLVVVVGPMTIAQKGMQSSFFANEQTTAVFLAQEGIELIQKLRDDNALDVYDSVGSDTTWDWIEKESYNKYKIDRCISPSSCDVNVAFANGKFSDFKDCSNPGACNLKQFVGKNPKSAYGYDNGNDWVASPFTRTIVITKYGSEIVSVTVTVSWTSLALGPHSVTLQTWLYDQYKRYE